MRVVATVIGTLILLFLGIPTLIGVIWATGAVRSVLAEDFFSELSETLTTHVPELLDESLVAAQEPGATTDPRVQAWVAAVSQVGAPSELMRRTGITAWLEGELAITLHQVSEMLRGNVPPEEIILDMRPIKSALLAPQMRQTLDAILAHLPACDPPGLTRWEEVARAEGHDDEPMPACNPGPEVSARFLTHSAAQIPDEFPMFESENSRPPVEVLRTIDVAMWLLFVIPLGLIVLGAVLAGRGMKGFLRWSGATVLLGGLATLGTSLAADALPWATRQWPRFGHNRPSEDWFWSTEPGQELAARLSADITHLMAPIYSNVQIIAAVVAGVGLLLLVLSAFARRRRTVP